MIITPSILEKTAEDLFAQIQKLSPYYHHFQIDTADGIFVPNTTVQIQEIITYLSDNPLPKSNQKITFEFHLMVKNFIKEIEQIVILQKYISIKEILIHVSLSPDLQLLTSNYPLLPFGLVFNPEDSVNKLIFNHPLENIQNIQIMTVHPGFQGQPFVEESLQKIEQLRINGYKGKVSLDGAINENTVLIITSKKYIPDILCPGSFLTKTNNLEKHVKILRQL